MYKLIVDMLLPSMDPILHSLDLIPAILQRVDTALYQRVLKAVRPPHFAASAVMTWFSHDIDDLDKVATIFDFLISSPPVMIFYLTAAVFLFHFLC
jgi:TBC1 domain family member 20